MRLRPRSRETAETAPLSRHNPALGELSCRHHVRRSKRLKPLPWFPHTTATRRAFAVWHDPVAQAHCGGRALQRPGGHLTYGGLCSMRNSRLSWAGLTCFIRAHERHVNTVQRCLRGGKSQGAAGQTYPADPAAGLGAAGFRESPAGGAAAVCGPGYACLAPPRKHPSLILSHVSLTTSSQAGQH